MMQNCIGIIVYLESKIPGQMIQLLPAYNGSWSNNSGAPSIGATGRVGLGVTVGEGVAITRRGSDGRRHSMIGL